MTGEVKSLRATKQQIKAAKALIAMFTDILPEVAGVSAVAAYNVAVAVLALEEELRASQPLEV